MNKLEFESQGFSCLAKLYVWPWLDLLQDRVLAGLGPHGSWSFSPVGGNCLDSEGELAYVLSEKRKEDCQNLLTGACGQPERELLAWPLLVFWQPALGSAAFPRAKIWSRGLTVLRTGDSTAVEHQTGIWCAPRRKVTPPLQRGWISGAKGSSETRMCGSKRAENKLKPKRTKK